MSRSPILPIVFGAALCVAPTIILAQTAQSTQSAQSEEKPAATVQDTSKTEEPKAAETGQTEAKTVQTPRAKPGSETTETTAVAESGTETSLPMEAIAGHIAAFNAFIYREAVTPTVNLASASVDAANKSVRWAWDGSAKSATWAWDGSSKSVSWVWDGSTGTLSAVVGGIGSSMGALSEKITRSPYWPSNAMDKFVEDLHGEEFVEFANLVDETGFAVADVKVGVGLIPELAVEFKHVRDLSDGELEEVDKQIHAYTTHASKGVGYIESVILHNLVEAGKYAGKTDLASVSIKLFPLPGLVLKFDPFHFEEHKANKLKSAFDLASITADAEKKLEDRLMNIEAELKRLHGKEETDTN